MNPSEVKDLAGGLSQQPAEAEDSLIRGTPVRAEAVLTKPGRVGTARRRGFGERDEKVYERNQRVKSRKRRADSNLVDLEAPRDDLAAVAPTVPVQPAERPHLPGDRRVGAIFGLEISRLARSSADLSRLLAGPPD